MLPISGHNRKTFLALFLLLAAAPLWAHTVNYALADAPTQNIVGFYLKLGIQHIIPEGLDHILFVVGLCLISTKFKTILWQATAFTVAHTITLALSMQGTIAVPAALVEPVIALSIAFIAIENLILTGLKPWRIAVVFLFGLIHGMGFANALNETGLPPNRFYMSILSFNAGVEIGQIIVILLVFGLLVLPLGRKPWYKKWVVTPLSILIALTALYWTVQRL